MSETNPRALMPDYLRLVALFGIVVVNVQFIAFSVLESVTAPLAQSTGDAVALFLVNGLALSKSYGLFSFMFGVGLGFLMRASERSGRPLKQIYRNRMIGLFLLGLAHGCLFFPGDILVVYAITGSIFFRFRDWEVGRLIRLASILLVLGALMFAGAMLLPEDDSLLEFMEIEKSALVDGSFLDAVIFRSVGFAITVPFTLIVQGVSALGWFCLGLAAVKSGMIDAANHPQWRRARRLCLIPGMVISLAGAAIWQWANPPLGGFITMLAAPIATLGYLGLIAAMAARPGRLMSGVLRAGGASLTIYLGQSILLSTIFAGYGFGLWEAVDRTTATLIAIAVTLALIAGVSLWRMRFPQGPFEMLLRRMTYAGTRTT